MISLELSFVYCCSLSVTLAGILYTPGQLKTLLVNCNLLQDDNCMDACPCLHLSSRQKPFQGWQSQLGSGELTRSMWKIGGNFGDAFFMPFQSWSQDEPLNNSTTPRTSCSLSSSVFKVPQDTGGLKDTILGRSFDLLF